MFVVHRIWVFTFLSLCLVAVSSVAHASGFKLASLIPIDAAARSIVTADFNHDGKADVAVASYDSEATVSVFLGRVMVASSRVRYPVGSGPTAWLLGT